MASLPLLYAELVGPPCQVVLAPGACVCVLTLCGSREESSHSWGNVDSSLPRATCAALFVRPVRSRMICSRLPPRWGRDPHPPTAPARRP